MVDMQEEAFKLKRLLALGVLLLISGCYSWGEIEYLAWGRTAEAEVASARVEQYRTRRSGTVERLVVKYVFTDVDGTRRTESMAFDPDTPPPVGLIEVEYISGRNGSSRLPGDVRWWSVILFGAAIVAFAIFLVMMHRRANRTPTWRGRPVR